MISLERFEEVMSNLADELPEELYQGLNRGIVVSARAKRHPKGADGGLYILGEYESGGPMGQGIIIYYRSFGFVFGNLPEEGLITEMRKTLRHEFRHHWEYLAGENALEVEDERRIAAYLAEQE